MGPVNDELLNFLKEVKTSKRDKDESIDLLGHLLLTIIDNNVDSAEYKNVGLTVGAYTRKARFT